MGKPGVGALVIEDLPDEDVGLEEAFGPTDFPENDMPLHAKMHTEHTADEHYPGDVHMDEEDTPFVPEGSLEAPTPRQGFEQHWVRMGVNGQPDARNRASMQRLGWVPRQLASVPDGLQRHYPAFHHKTFGDVIMQGDLVLCERPKQLGDAERKHYLEAAKRQAQLTDVMKSGPASHGGFHQVEVVERRRKVVTRRPIQAADGG